MLATFSVECVAAGIQDMLFKIVCTSCERPEELGLILINAVCFVLLYSLADGQQRTVCGITNCQ